MNNLAINLISGFLIIMGTLGAVLPLLPGLPVAWLGLLLFAWYTHFAYVGVWGLVVFGILIGLTMLVDLFAPAIMAAGGGKASRFGILGATIGGFAGIFFLGPLGILFGPFVGAYIGEILNNASREHALKVAWASMLGLVIGSLFKLLIGTTMFIYFLIKLF
ncbi:MAG: DUF456 domain-containing protein [Candidatus Doudnabacteria bacterium]|nr:DUF456 domain-containing protein [Candidatus Doudnabacteria bacterium]